VEQRGDELKIDLNKLGVLDEFLMSVTFNFLSTQTTKGRLEPFVRSSPAVIVQNDIRRFQNIIIILDYC
jgi:hypothetical protein